MDLELSACKPGASASQPSEAQNDTLGNSGASANALGTRCSHDNNQPTTLNLNNACTTDAKDLVEIAPSIEERTAEDFSNVLGKGGETFNVLNSVECMPGSAIEYCRPFSEVIPDEAVGFLSVVDFSPEVSVSPDVHCEEEDHILSSSIAIPHICEDFPSSSPPSSSPLGSSCFRSSSPIPTTSSPPTSPIKPSKTDPDVGTDKSETNQKEDIETEVRKKIYPNFNPGPKRPTLAAQKAQRQMLSKPFRPPAIQKPTAELKQGNEATSHDDTGIKSASGPSLFTQKIQEKMRDRTAKAAAQFKSPLTLNLNGGEERAPVARPTPVIQAQERKVQLLKRALKVKEGSEEEVLSGLIQKWSEAGREVAWEIWGLVKDSGELGNRKRQMEDSWGWQEGGECKIQRREEGEDERRGTLEGMLVDMGIAPSTLGFVE